MVQGKVRRKGLMRIEEFKLIISEISGEPVENIKESSSFRDDLSIDSLQMVHLVMEVASRFNLELSKVQSISDLSTVGKMYETFKRDDVQL